MCYFGIAKDVLFLHKIIFIYKNTYQNVENL
jgi:hypothetical protein